MTLLRTLADSPFANAAGWAVVHSLWMGAIASLALAVVLVAVNSPRLRYAAACVAMLLVAVGFALAFGSALPGQGSESEPFTIVRIPPWSALSGEDPSAFPRIRLAAYVPWLTPFWIAGVGIFHLAHLASWISITRMRCRGVCTPSDHWQKRFRTLCERLSISRPVLLLESCLVEAPIVLGHLRPAVLMPVGLFTGLPAAQVEAILLHELTHIRRHDFLVNVLQRLLEGLLFYHPAVWWMSNVIRNERENCCDDAVVAMNGDAREYAAALAALEQNRWSGREPAVAATGGNLMKRIRRLLHPQNPVGAWTPALSALALAAAAAGILSAWQAAPSTTQERAASPYLYWLNQDVVYLIGDKERAAFLKLSTDPEREKFIEQFWTRRDRTPGTPENEMKEEHYRRIGYVNDRFGTASAEAGWRTDRGRLYIVHGPPDEVESHLKPPGRPNSTEAWKYAYLEGIGANVIVKFIDKTGTGDYQRIP